MFIAAEANFKTTKETLNSAIVQSDQGGGTPFNEGDPEEDYTRPTVPDNPSVDRPARKPSKAPEPEQEEELEEELEETEPDAEPEKAQGNPKAAARLIAKHGGDPSMQWKLDDLIRFAQAKGIEADTSWTKAQVLGEIENLDAD